MTATTEISPPEVTPPRIVLRAITVIGIALALFQLDAAGVQPLGLFFQRPIHLGFVLVLCFLSSISSFLFYELYFFFSVFFC